MARNGLGSLQTTAGLAAWRTAPGLLFPRPLPGQGLPTRVQPSAEISRGIWGPNAR
jgi:hypothetical protein